MPVIRFGTTLILAVLLLLGSCNKGDGGQAGSSTAGDSTASGGASTSAATGSEQSSAATGAEQASVQATGWSGDAINFSFTTADGESRTADSYAGKPLVLNFWAAW